MANYAETSKNFTGAFMTGIQGVNTGIVIPWTSASIPSGFLECNGQSVSQTTYAALFAVIGTTYGNPGGGNFNVPDLTDRTIVNKSNTKNLAQTGGNNTVTPTGNVAGNAGNTTLTTAEIAAHTHNTATGSPFGYQSPSMSARGAMVGDLSNTGSSAAHNHNISEANFTGSATSVLQPFLVLIYIIKT